MTSTQFTDQLWFRLATPLPALVFGVLVMRRNDVPFAIWGQNLIAGLFFMIVCVSLLRLPPLSSKRLQWGVALTVILSVGLLLATFADARLNGVHRWVVVGSLRIHAGAVCLPALILTLGEILNHPEWKLAGWFAALPGVGVAGLLLLQPDAAQASAFAGALIVLLVSCRQTLRVSWVAALLIAVCAVWSWMRPDPLLPVPHVEGIVGLAAQNGRLWLLASLASLALLPCPFLLDWGRVGRTSPTSLALGLYFALNVIAPCLGSFPVPLLGFGLSPIAGYFVALTWLLSPKPGAKLS